MAKLEFGEVITESLGAAQVCYMVTVEVMGEGVLIADHTISLQSGNVEK